MQQNNRAREIVDFFASYLNREYGLGVADIQELLTKKVIKEEPDRILIPASIFRNDYLSVLETVTKYLRKEKELSYSKIASLLNRSAGPIGITYRKAKQKMPAKLHITAEPITIPVEIFKDRILSVLEVLTEYLKDKFELSYHQAAVMLNRDDRTIWTVYFRAKKKRTFQR